MRMSCYVPKPGLVGLVSVCAKFQFASLPKSGLKVPGSGVVMWCC